MWLQWRIPDLTLGGGGGVGIVNGGWGLKTIGSVDS